MLNITGITVDHLAEHIVTDNPHPVISFSIESDRENVLMSRTRISIGGWSLETGEQTGIAYRGEDLKPFSAYEVSVRAGDSCGEQAAASVIFHTGRRDLPWQGSWITDAGYVFRGKKTSPVPMMFRKNFRAGEEPVCAVICSTAMGIYELTLNGRKVGKDFFAPGFTSYYHQLQYQIYDITEQLQTNNCLTVTVAGGWAVGAYTYARYNRLYADRQAFLAEIRIRYRDGREEVIGTDESWLVTEDGPYRAAEFYDGEVYDATIDPEKISWHPAGKTGLKKHPRIKASYGVPVREHEILQPVSCLKARSGKIIYDFGQNMAGVIRAGVKGRAGQRILFEHAEVLRDGELYTEPLRTAKQQAVYICRDGFQTYQPHFTYMGFRYVAVSGIEEEDIRLSAVALYSEVPSIGSFCCSDERLNRLQKCIEWGAKSNFVDIPTDCPQRDERLGWTGDIALFAPTASFQFDMSRFFRKWLREDGSVNLGTQDGGSGMVSFNHYVCGSVGDFLYRRIAGIEPLEGGYRKFRCAPLTGGGITSAQGSTRTPYGTLSVRWEIKDDIFHLEAVVPTGTEGEIVLPDGNVIHTGSGRKRFQCKIPADRQEAG